MTPHRWLDLALGPAFRLLPPAMESPQARALVLAIALQESRLAYRRQINGPARSYLQFELAGIAGVLTHPATQHHAAAVCDALDIVPAASAVYTAIEWHDSLAVCFGRLALWALPDPLPGPQDPDVAWQQYLAAWRPGRPRPETWAGYYTSAWMLVGAPA